MTAVEGFKSVMNIPEVSIIRMRWEFPSFYRPMRLVSTECNKVSTLIRCSINVFWNAAMVSWCPVMASGHHDACRAGIQKWISTTGGGGDLYSLKESSQSLRWWVVGVPPGECTSVFCLFVIVGFVFHLLFHWLSLIPLLWPAKGFFLGITLFQIFCEHRPLLSKYMSGLLDGMLS